MEKDLQDFKECCQEYLLDKLKELRGEEVFLSCDYLTDRLTSYDVMNGAITHWESTAEEYIQEWSWDAGEYLDSMQDRFGKIMCNPFKSPDLFMVLMVREGVYLLLLKCPIMEKYKEQNKKITRQFLTQLKRELDDIPYVDW